MNWDEQGYLAHRQLGDTEFPSVVLMPLTFGRVRVALAPDEFSLTEHY